MTRVRSVGAPRRRRMKRVAVVLPSGFTLANLFFGIFAIVAASRGDLRQAVLYIVLGGVADALDGRVARATGSGTALGQELDSLVDVISFGLAPSMLMYFAVLNRNGWDWVFCFAFTACAALRLARFNVTQAGTEKRYFHGLPSPAAGLTLATYYWFSQTPLYNETNIVDLPWHVLLRWLMMVLGALMVSEASYPAVPTVGFRNPRQLVGLGLVLATILGVLFAPKEFFFPALLAYDLWGLARLVFFGLIGRREVADDMLMRESDEERPELAPTAAREPVSYGVSDAAPADAARRRRRRRRRRPGDGRRSDPDDSPPSAPEH